MTAPVHIEPFQWVLAFDQPFGPHDRSLAEQIEMFTSRGGGWDSINAREIFLVHQVQRVCPKTYWSVGARRFDRTFVIATGQSEAAVIALRDKIFAIGVGASDAIEAEMYRLIKPFAADAEHKALQKIHAALPHIFGRTPGL